MKNIVKIPSRMNQITKSITGCVNTEEWMNIDEDDVEKLFWVDVMSDDGYELWLTLTTKHDKYQYNSETISGMFNQLIHRVNEVLFGKRFNTYKDVSRRNHLKGIVSTERQILRNNRTDKDGGTQSCFNKQLHSHILIRSWDNKVTPDILVTRLNEALRQVIPKIKHNNIQFFDERGVYAETTGTSRDDKENLGKYLLKTASTNELDEERFSFISFLGVDGLDIDQVYFKRKNL